MNLPDVAVRKIKTVYVTVIVMICFCSLSSQQISNDESFPLTMDNTIDKFRSGDNPILNEYFGYVELWMLEYPLLFLQLAKWGDNALLPSIDFTIRQSLGGQIMQRYNFRNPTFISGSQMNLHASLKGTRFRLEFSIPDGQLHCPECVYEEIEFRDEPPNTHDTYIWRHYTLFIKNYIQEMTFNVEMGPDGLEINDLDIEFNVGEILHVYENGIIVYPDGQEEELILRMKPDHQWLITAWHGTTGEKRLERVTSEILNCILRNGKKSDAYCKSYLDEPLHMQSVAEMFHAFGLAAFNKQRLVEKSFGLYVDLTENPITTINRVLFDFGTLVLQAGKIVSGIREIRCDSYVLSLPWTIYNYTKEECSELEEDELRCDTIREEITISGTDGIPDCEVYPTLLRGAEMNDAQIIFGDNNFSYMFRVPDLVLNVADFQKTVTNLNTTVQIIYSQLELSVVNSTVGLTVDFGFDMDVGVFTVSNVKVILDLGEIVMSIPKVAQFESGSWTELPAWMKDAAPMIMDLWREQDDNGVTLKERYSNFVEEKLNDFLAGRSLLQYENVSMESKQKIN